MPEILKGKQKRGRKVVVYGGPGVGKSTFAASAPRPIFIPTEDGCGHLDCDKYPVAKSNAEFGANLGDFIKGHLDSYDTVIIDTADWLEALIHSEICGDDGDIVRWGGGYGAGYRKADAMFYRYIKAFQALADRGKVVCILAHDSVDEVSDPQHGAYKQTTLGMHKYVRDRLIEWADDLLFMAPKISVDEDSKRATGGKNVVLYTAMSPAFRAKSRCNCPPEIVVPRLKDGNPWEAYWKHVS